MPFVGRWAAWVRVTTMHDNAVAESFFAMFRKELIHTKPWPSPLRPSSPAISPARVQNRQRPGVQIGDVSLAPVGQNSDAGRRVGRNARGNGPGLGIDDRDGPGRHIRGVQAVSYTHL